MKKFVLLFLLVLMICCSTGCRNKDVGAEPVHTAAVIGIRSCSVIPTDMQPLQASMTRSVESGGSVSITRVDGSPECVYYNIFDGVPSGGTSNQKEAYINEQLQSVYAAIGNVRAEVEEADVLSAITLAVRQLNSVESGQRVLFVYDSMLQTCGVLPFQNTNLLDDPSSEIMENIRSQKLLPDMSDIEVHILGAGDTRPPQKELNEQNRTNLMSVWETIFSAAGARSVSFHSNISVGNTELEDLPAVSVVPVKDESLFEDIALTEDVLSFKANSSAYLDEDKAEATLRDIAGRIMGSNEEVYVIGTAASGGTEECSGVTLSLERANAVKSTLEELGVTKIKAFGLGYDERLCIKDVDENGFNEALGKRNRTVYIVSANSEKAKLVQ